MASNDFLPFATNTAANVLDQADYAKLPAQQYGFQPGEAFSAQINKVLRQSSILSSVLAQFIVNTTGQSAVDDGTTATLLANLNSAIILSGGTGIYTPTVSVVLPNTSQTLVVLPGTITSAITLSLPSAPTSGTHYKIYGSASAYSVTVASSVTSGSPYIHLPDGTKVYSYVLSASYSSWGIDLIWDGTNWKGQTFGPTIVAPATASGHAVNLSQVLGLSPMTATTGVGTPAANTLYTASVSMTAPCAGWIAGLAIYNGTASGNSPQIAIVINGTVGNFDNTGGRSMSEVGAIAVASGSSNTIACRASTSGTAPSGFSVYVLAIFIPNP